MSKSSRLSEVFEFDDVNAAILVFGQRRATIDLAGLCRHLDQLVGDKVAAVIVANHSKETAKENLASIRETNPTATFGEIIEALTEVDILKGFGLVKITRHNDQVCPVELEMRNPIIRASTGTGVKFILSYWEGVLGALLNKTLEMTDVVFDGNANVKCRFAVIGVPRP